MEGCGPLAPRRSGWICSRGTVLESPPAEVPVAGVTVDQAGGPSHLLTAKPQCQPQAAAVGEDHQKGALCPGVSLTGERAAETEGQGGCRCPWGVLKPRT